MTDDPRDAIDALLSSDLDGETDPDQHSRIEADPALTARRNELQRASALVGQPPAPLSDASVDQLIGDAVSSARAPSSIVAPPRPSTAGARSGPPPVLVAAVVVLLAAIGIGLIVTAKSPHKDRADVSQPTAAHGEAKSGAPTTVPTTTPGANRRDAASQQASPTPLGFIGDYASPAALRSRLVTRVPAPRSSSTTFAAPRVSQGQADRCASVLEARDPRLVRANRRTSVAASIKGTPVVVLEYRANAVQNARTTTRVVALGVTACDERVNFQR